MSLPVRWGDRPQAWQDGVYCPAPPTIYDELAYTVLYGLPFMFNASPFEALFR